MAEPCFDPATRVLVEKAALDNGWEIPPQPQASGWLRCASSRFEDPVWIGLLGDELALACPRKPLLAELARDWPQIGGGLPHGTGGIVIPGLDVLDAVMRRAAHLARSLPNQVAKEFARRVGGLPRSTEAERLVVRRVGHELFRSALIDYWEGRCAVTGLDIVELLRASHIKPWAKCASDEERLDVYNGLLLTPHLDALFDGGWITFADNGEAIASPRLPVTAFRSLGIAPDAKLCVGRLESEHLMYLRHHRARVFRA